MEETSAPPGLAGNQVAMVCDWALRLPRVTEVRLFGSRAKGTHRPTSDVDLAVTVLGVRRGIASEDDGFTTFWFDHDDWEADLSARLGLPVHLERYDADTHPKVFGYCAEFSLLIWQRSK